MTDDNLKLKLRETLLTKAKFRKEIFEYEGVSYELRQPSIRQRGELSQKCTIRNKETKTDDIDYQDFVIWLVIKCTFVPNTDERVFKDTDYDDIKDLPTGGVIDKLSEIIANLSNVKEDSKKKSRE